MKYVLTENGNIKIGKNGKPLVVGDDDKEFEIDAISAQETISNLHAESAGHRKKAAEYKKIVDKVGDLDVDAAKQALQTVESMTEDHKLEVEKLKQSMNATWQEKHNAEIEKNKKLADDLYNATVTAKFATSPVVKTTILTPDIAAKVFGSHFQADGTAVDANGNAIYSKEKPGEPAGFDEALQTLIERYPNKEAILRGSGAGGSGTHRTGNGAGDSFDQGKYYEKGSKHFNRTKQAEIARTDPDLHKQLKSQYE